MLVAGMTIVGAAQDAIDEFYLTASARLLDVVMRTAGIVVGIVASLELAWRLGAPLSISPEPVALGPLGAQFVGATLISAFFALCGRMQIWLRSGSQARWACWAGRVMRR